ncbi:MAG: hypothetical protein PHN68_05785 [Prolixibacteraceae bacterium]|nr:hypothetical protein [Prolixibacteraceae bacterium]NLO01638.1 hypothetical protein [Bacteroidales bacterium]
MTGSVTGTIIQMLYWWGAPFIYFRRDGHPFTTRLTAHGTKEAVLLRQPL